MLGDRHKECFSRIETLSIEQGVRLFVVGGIVRDLLRGLDLNKNDVDILVEGDALSFARQVQSDLGGALNLFPEFLTAKLRSPDLYPELREIDFASARTETYGASGSLPIVSIATIADDLGRRDFSINALAIPFRQLQHIDRAEIRNQQLMKVCIDRFHGISDLEQGLIRVLHPNSFIDDPTRLFRALRYRARINGSLDSQTAIWFEQAIAQGVLAHISTRRQLNELVKIFSEENATNIIESSIVSGLLGKCFLPYVAADSARSVLAERLLSLAELPAEYRTKIKGGLENCMSMILIEITPDQQRKDLYQRLSMSRQTRSTLEEDIEMAEESERGHIYSVGGLFYCAIRQPEMRDWALEQLKGHKGQS